MSNGDTLCCCYKVKLVIIITAHKHPPTHVSCLNYTVRINVVLVMDIRLGIILYNRIRNNCVMRARAFPTIQRLSDGKSGTKF